MAVIDSQTLKRLRSEEGLAEQKGRQALNIAAILKDFPQFDAARQKADALMAKASCYGSRLSRSKPRQRSIEGGDCSVEARRQKMRPPIFPGRAQPPRSRHETH
jgi:hypothetical protein